MRWTKKRRRLFSLKIPTFPLHSFTPLSPPADSVVLTYLMNFIASGSARAVETNGVVSGLEQKPYAIIAVAGARVYHTKLQEKDHQWNYSRWKGILTLGRDLDTPDSIAQGTSEAEKHWFRLADVESGRTVWMFKFPENFEYELDRPFFHVFQGRVCLFYNLFFIRRYWFALDNCRLGATDFSSTTTMKLRYLVKRLWPSCTVQVSTHFYIWDKLNNYLTPPPRITQKNTSSQEIIKIIY